MATTIDVGSVADFVKAAESADRIAVYVTTLNKYFPLTAQELRACVSSLEPGEQVIWMVEEYADVSVSLMATTQSGSDGK